MMVTLSTYARQGRQFLRTYLADPKIRAALHGAGLVLGGLLLSAASISHAPMPLTMGLICAAGGWNALLLGLGGVLGYPLFWGRAGFVGIFWSVWGVGTALVLENSRQDRENPFLMPAVSALGAALGGVLFRLWLAERAALGLLVLRMGLAAGSAWVFRGAKTGKDVYCRWLAWACCILAAAQLAPFPWLRLGYVGAGLIAVAAPFPAAALSGLALDIAGVAKVPMTAVTCLVYLFRLLPFGKKWAVYAAPVPIYLMLMYFSGRWDLLPVLPLALGGGLGSVWNARPDLARRRGSTALAQVRLEMVSGAFRQMQELLLESASPPLDEAALMQRSAARACGSCPNRKACRERELALRLPPELLHKPLDGGMLPFVCRKTGRLIGELRRGQEQLRMLSADRARQKEYHWALIQQYQFLAGYLQQLSDTLGSRDHLAQPRFTPEIAACANRPREENGDRCQWFAGVGNQYYVLLCDGMGTGPGAVEEGSAAAALLKRLLSAGFPAEYALRSLNSLCALRGRAGAVTVDLVRIHLDTGHAWVYKWGAAPSWLMGESGAEKIGTATPPPGLSVADGGEQVQRLSLRRGEALVLLSDGVGGEEALSGRGLTPDRPPGELAAGILACGNFRGKDDATVIVVRLRPGASAT